ncbi:hypothetical protein BDU57DRAFT_113718 [Ampelomyces quisqualis]|uniref:Ubiquitin-like protease family profile domain-containing protein n=1 Tax=Ampelomyces quisqualis TaxID=50730 RepID=A0A6A5Q5X6_AMPQU|nr:hypothetical protein BDU57DRAFT_113718 [Ampelomyces quisqualis]
MASHGPSNQPSEDEYSDEAVVKAFAVKTATLVHVARDGASREVQHAFRETCSHLIACAKINADRTYRRDNPNAPADIASSGWQYLVDNGLETLSSHFWQAVALWGIHEHFLQTWEAFAAKWHAPTAVQTISSTKARDVPPAFRQLREILSAQKAWGADCYRRLSRVAPFPVSPKQSFVEKLAKLARTDKIGLAEVERDLPSILKNHHAYHRNDAFLLKSLDEGNYTVTPRDLEEFIRVKTTRQTTSQIRYREPSRRDRTRVGPRTRRSPSPVPASIASPELSRGPQRSLLYSVASDADDSASDCADDIAEDDFGRVPSSPISDASLRASPALEFAADDTRPQDSLTVDGSILLTAATASSPHPSKVKPEQVSEDTRPLSVEKAPLGEPFATVQSQRLTSQNVNLRVSTVSSPQVFVPKLATATATEVSQPNPLPQLPETKPLPSPPLSETCRAPGGLTIVNKKRKINAIEFSELGGNAPHKQSRKTQAVVQGSSDLVPGAELTSRTLDLLLRQLACSHEHDYAFYDPGNMENSEHPAKVSPGKFSKVRNVLVWLCLRRHWILLRFNLEHMEVYKYDSLPGYVAPSVVDEKVALICNAIWVAAGRNDNELEHWAPTVMVTVPKQANSFDCGIWVIVTTLRITNGYDTNLTQNTSIWRMLLQAFESDHGRTLAFAHFAELLQRSSSHTAIVSVKRDVDTIQDLTQKAYATAKTCHRQHSDRTKRLASAIKSERCSRRRHTTLLRKLTNNVQALDEQDAALEADWLQQLKPTEKRLAVTKDNMENLQRLQVLVAEFAGLVDKQHAMVQHRDNGQRVKELETKLVARRTDISQAREAYQAIEAELAGLKGVVIDYIAATEGSGGKR